MAMSRAKALSIARSVTISRGFRSSSMIFINCLAERFTNSLRSSQVARIVPLPGNARPRPSARQFMELAVNMPEQEPQDGQP
ncbi:hypothetical protein D3C73_1581780 [compost metagenome]